MSYTRFKSVSSFGAVQLLRPTRHVKKKAIVSVECVSDVYEYRMTCTSETRTLERGEDIPTSFPFACRL